MMKTQEHDRYELRTVPFMEGPETNGTSFVDLGLYSRISDIVE
jgi:hypothetical protein